MAEPRDPPRRILVLASTYPRWPDDTLPPFVHELARRLTSHCEMHVLAPHTAGSETYEIIDGVHVHRFQYLPARFETLAYGSSMLAGLRHRPWRLLALPLFLAAEWLAAVRLLRRRRFDAIHAHWLLPHGLIALLARHVSGYRPALLCTSHGADLYGLRGRLARTLRHFTVRHADHVTVVSAAMQTALQSECGALTHMSVLPMGVDTRNRFVPPLSPISRGGLLFVGRLAEKKGINVLLEAMARLKEMPNLSLHVVGGGSEEAALKQQCARLGLQKLVDFVGPVSNRDLPLWYQRHAVLVFPSVVTAYGDQEGLGLVPAEALACGCAVVASDLPAVRDVIRDDETGLLVPSGDPLMLAEALQTMLENRTLAERLAARGCAHVQERFDWDVIAARYWVLFQDLMSRH